MLMSEMTMPEFEAALAKTTTVVIPYGSVEEHGPHLPLSTDTLHAQEVAKRAAALYPLLVAPPVHYGLCRSTSEHPGTLSISGNTLKALTLEVGKELYRQGCRQIILLTGHAGGTHVAALIEAGEGLLRELTEIRVAVVNILDLLGEALKQAPDLVQTRGDAHAGEVETGLMLSAHPELVRGTAAPEWPAFPKFILSRKKRKFWPGGVWGDPGAGTREKGEKILQYEVNFLVEIVQALERFED
jgi:creatinine amidohydrolase